MKIMVIGSHPESLIRFRGDLLQQMVACGHEVHAACPDFDSDVTTRGILDGMGVITWTIPLSRTGLNPLRDAWTLVALLRLMERVRPAHVLAYTIKPVIYGMLAAGLRRVPGRAALITGLGYAFTEAGSGRRGLLRVLLQSLYRLALRTARVVIFQNPDDRRLFEEMKLVEAGRCRQVNGSGINLERFFPAGFPDPKQGVQFLLIARLLRDKGIREYVAAARRLRARHPDCRFHLVGWIDSNPAAFKADEVEEWTREGIVQYHGRLEDVRPILAQAHVYVLPSYREGTPRTVLEAMAMGRPVVTTDAPGCRETVVEGENGFLVPVKAVEELATAMERFIVNPALIASMGKASRLLAVTRFDVQAVNAALFDAMGLPCEKML